MAKSAKFLNRNHVLQQDTSDCGVACLKAVLRFFGSDATFEILRNYSGTSKQGTTLLGLVQASEKLGLGAEGFEATIEHLKKCKEITILHISMDNYKGQHYVVCYGYDEREEKFWIGDPSEKLVKKVSPAKLNALWKTKALLLFKPTSKLIKTYMEKKQKARWFKQLIQEDFNVLLFASCFGILVAVLGLSTAVFSQKLIDDIIPSGNSSKLVAGFLVLFILLTTKIGLGYIRSYMLIRQGRDFNIRVLDSFFSGILDLPKLFFDSRRTGDLVARMNDTQRIQKTISTLVSQASIDILLGLVAWIGICIYEWEIGLASFVWFPLFFYLFKRFRPKILEGQENSMKYYSLTESRFMENIQGVGEIKRRNKQNIFFKITKFVYQKWHQIGYDLALICTQYKVAIEFLGVLFLVFFLGWSSFSVLETGITIGVMIAILQLLGMMINATTSLAQSTISWDEARIAFDRMYEFTSLKREFEEVADCPEISLQEVADIRIDNLAFRFPGKARLFEDVSIRVQKGEIIAILGESGCGKSTLRQILERFYQKESGSIKVNGTDLDLIAFESWRAKLGVVPQEVQLFNGTLIDNILLGDRVENSNELESFFKYYGFDLFFQKFPNGYVTLLGESGVNISGGQKQLVGLARALYHRPELLLLDEPTSSLDRNAELFVLGLLKRLKERIAVVIFTHRLKTAKKADRIYIIEKGKISHQGTHHQLLQLDNFYSKGWADLMTG